MAATLGPRDEFIQQNLDWYTLAPEGFGGVG